MERRKEHGSTGHRGRAGADPSRPRKEPDCRPQGSVMGFRPGTRRISVAEAPCAALCSRPRRPNHVSELHSPVHSPPSTCTQAPAPRLSAAAAPAVPQPQACSYPRPGQASAGTKGDLSRALFRPHRSMGRLLQERPTLPPGPPDSCESPTHTLPKA